MPQPPNDSVLISFELGMMLLSLLVGLSLIQVARREPPIAYEPRRPVPWGPLGALLAILQTSLALYSAYLIRSGENSQKPLETLLLVAFMVQQLVVVGGFLLVIALTSRANFRDLGLPRANEDIIPDIRMGALACLVALAPVHIVQVVLMSLLFPQEKVSGHQLIKTVMSNPSDSGIMLLAGLLAVVVAPVCEEIVFRMLLQGWLEKWEDNWLGWRAPPEDAKILDEESLFVDDDVLPADESSFSQQPPRRGLAGLPYGWVPVLISAFVFGLAHIGYGPEPVPIFLLGLVRGYLYQRTHRVIPSIVAHALFNSFTMLVLLRTIYHRG